MKKKTYNDLPWSMVFDYLCLCLYASRRVVHSNRVIWLQQNKIKRNHTFNYLIAFFSFALSVFSDAVEFWRFQHLISLKHPV